MKATLEFQLPEDRGELDHTLNGPTYAGIIHLVQERLRAITKYENEEMHNGTVDHFSGRHDAVREIRDLIADLLDERGLGV